MTVLEIYEGSNGDATKALYAELEKRGPVGVVALNLFRASKCSERAKLYTKRAHKDEAYRRKDYSLQQLSDVLTLHAGHLHITWGWKLDPLQEFYPWVLYVEIPTGQCSFHNSARKAPVDYAGEWDGQKGKTAGRIVSWVSAVHKTVALPTAIDRLIEDAARGRF